MTTQERDAAVKQLELELAEVKEKLAIASQTAQSSKESDAARVQELQGLVDFFKRNSEKNSKLVSELTEKVARAEWSGRTVAQTRASELELERE